MKKKCNYCESYYDDALENCPQCGAPNDNIRKSIGVPRTIEELQQWYVQHNLPPKEVTRFFIGENYKGPKAFGIYKDEETGQFVVYKNKSDGSRAIRYDGKDESYAVNEIYVKLKEQIAEEKSKNVKKNARNTKRSTTLIQALITIICITVIFTIITLTLWSRFSGPSHGEYTYNNQDYYYSGGSWYIWDYDTDGWVDSDVPSELEENYRDYYDGGSNSDSFWDDDDDDDWDSDSSWDSGSDWGGSSDWDSDW